MQDEPMKPVLKAPGTMLLKLRCDGPLPIFAFNLNMRQYSQAVTAAEDRVADLKRQLAAAEESGAAAAARAAAAHAAQRGPKLRVLFPGKSGFFGVTREQTKDHPVKWRAGLQVPGRPVPNYSLGRTVQVDSINTRVESAFMVPALAGTI